MWMAMHRREAGLRICSPNSAVPSHNSTGPWMPEFHHLGICWTKFHLLKMYVHLFFIEDPRCSIAVLLWSGKWTLKGKNFYDMGLWQSINSIAKYLWFNVWIPVPLADLQRAVLMGDPLSLKGWNGSKFPNIIFGWNHSTLFGSQWKRSKQYTV